MDTPVNSDGRLTENPNTYPAAPEPEFSCRADATGYWFATAVVCAFLVAGVIVYRTGNQEIRIAGNDLAPAAAQADPLQPPPLLQTR
jgi:hypothetical protein